MDCIASLSKNAIRSVMVYFPLWNLFFTLFVFPFLSFFPNSFLFFFFSFLLLFPFVLFSISNIMLILSWESAIPRISQKYRPWRKFWNTITTKCFCNKLLICKLANKCRWLITIYLKHWHEMYRNQATITLNAFQLFAIHYAICNINY